MNTLNHKKTKYQSGLTLVELMIALVIGLVLIGGVIQIFVANNQTYRVTDNMSRLQENGRFALDALSRSIRIAGFKDNAVLNLTAPFTLPAPALLGLGFTDAEQFISGTDGAVGAANVLDDADDITIRYRGASAGNPLIDCIGNPVGAGNEVISRFYLDAVNNELECATTSGTQPLIDNVMAMQILYGVADNPTSNSANCYFPASALDGTNANCGSPTFNEVVSIRIKLLLATQADNLTSDGAVQTLTFDDNGAADTMVDRRIYRQFTQTISLRNKN